MEDVVVARFLDPKLLRGTVPIGKEF